MLGLATRAIAGDDEMQVNYAPGKPELDGKSVQLPEPSRVPSAKEIAVIRGWADSFALTAARHDQKLHNRLAPSAGPARAVFEAAERARVESLGAMRMPGMASNLTAKIEDQYAHGRFRRCHRPQPRRRSRMRWPCMVRESLTGLTPPATAKAMVDVWRPFIEEKAAKAFARHGEGGRGSGRSSGA